MARINIEKSLFIDNRFINLCIKLGSRREALGALAEAWIFAQTFVTPENPRGLVAVAQWETQGFAPELLDTGMARIEDGLVYMAGAEDQFKWLIQRQEAGRKGGRPPSTEKKSAPNAKRDPPETDRLAYGSSRLAEQTGRNPLPLSLSHNSNSKKVITKQVNPVVESKAAATAFEILPELDDPLTREILIKISPSAQKRWISQFKDPEWVKDTLIEAISFYTARGDANDDQWGVRLHHALNRARAAQKNAKSTGPRTANDPGFWENVFSETKEVGT